MPTTPKHNPARRNASVGVRRLPAAGRSGPVPSWPLTRPLKRELDTWASLWTMPQAVVWEEQRLDRSVARYVRALVAAEERGAPATLHAQVTAMEDRLGLTPKAMRLLLWVVDDDEDLPAAGEPAAATGTDGRRLRAVE